MHPGRPFSVRTSMQGEPITTPMPPLTVALLQHTHAAACEAPLAHVLEQVASASGIDAEEVFRQWRQLYRSLNDVGGFLTMSDLHASRWQEARS